MSQFRPDSPRTTPPAAGGSDDGDPALVATELGLVRGAVRDQVRVFQGIPYAAAPTGELRWRSPQPAESWSGVRDATREGDACPQPAVRPTGQSEDCLNLMVTTASAPSAGGKPVLVFLDAGGLVVSSNAGADHRRLVVEGDVVVVQPNERVGLFGFFAHPDLAEPAAGAFGLQDQQAALRWVQRNIAAFGGDPDNVTLLGISGGGICVCAHLAAPGSAGLFHRAIVQSGAAFADLSTYVPATPLQHLVRPLEQVEAAWAPLAEALGGAHASSGDQDGGVVERLRRLPVEAFGGHEADVAAFAHGNAVLPIAPIEALRTGRFHRVPVMIGATRDEATFWMNLAFPSSDGLDEATARGLLDDGTAAPDQVVARYPLSEHDGSAAAAVSAAHSDRFALRIRQTQLALAAHVPVFAYEFADRTAPLDPGYGLTPHDAVGVPYGAYHGSDFQYLIDTETYRARFDPEQAELSRQMITYWTTFAHHGAPDAGLEPSWPAFDIRQSVPHVQRLTTAAQGGIGPAGDSAARHQLAFWDALYPAHP